MSSWPKVSFFALFIVLLTSGHYARAENATSALTLGFMPYLNAETLLAKYTPLATYLSQKLGREVRITVAKDYASHIRLSGEDKIDIAFHGGSTYINVVNEYGPKPLIARYEFAGNPHFRSAIVVAHDSPYTTVSELKGKSVAFGNASSTLSSQVPLYVLMQSGVGLHDLGMYKHLRNHTNVVLGVKFGDFDAGAVAEEVFQDHRDNGIRALAYSPQVSTHVFITRSTMEPELRAQIAQALYNLKSEPNGQYVLGAIAGNMTGFVPAKDADYDVLRDILSQVLPILEQ